MSMFSRVLDGRTYLCSSEIKFGDKYYHDCFHPYPYGDIADTNTKVINANLMACGGKDDEDEAWKIVKLLNENNE